MPRVTITTTSSINGDLLIDTINQELESLGHLIQYVTSSPHHGKVVLSCFATRVGETYAAAIAVCKSVVKVVDGIHTTKFSI